MGAYDFIGFGGIWGGWGFTQIWRRLFCVCVRVFAYIFQRDGIFTLVLATISALIFGAQIFAQIFCTDSCA